MKKSLLIVVLLWCHGTCCSLDIVVTDEFHRIDPFGRIIEKDGKRGPVLLEGNTITIKAAARGYCSFNLGIRGVEGSKTALAFAFTKEGVEAELFRAWFHENRKEKVFYPGALIPLKASDRLECPAPDNKIKGQTCIGVWVDIWIPAEYTNTDIEGSLVVKSGDTAKTYSLHIRTATNPVPAEDAMEADHNSYGAGWIQKLFPKLKLSSGSDEYNRILHDVYRLMYEHRATVHNLGYSHNGSVSPIFVPQLEGEGPDKKIVSWYHFDRRFGPLLDGSAFKSTRRGRRPVKSIYLNINPEWPASLLFWGEKAYETEFVNVVSAMEKHFRGRGWVRTRFEMFFNHKKRYKAFSWDGDETKFSSDNKYFVEYGRLLRKAVPKDSPVDFVFRHDASWQMKNQVDELIDVIDMWILSGGVSSLYPEVIPKLKKKGHVTWVYGGASSIFSPSVSILTKPMEAWMKGADGYEFWLFTNPGGDPWFNCDGCNTGMIFSGEPFGMSRPLPCIRLKIQRNFLQDIALANALFGREQAAEKAASIAGLAPKDWYVTAPPPLVKKDPMHWNNPDIGEAGKTVRDKKDAFTSEWISRHRSMLLNQTMRPEVAAGPRFPSIPEIDYSQLTPPKENAKKKPTREEAIRQMERIAHLATKLVNGEEAAKIMTDRGAKKFFTVDPRDKWAGGDNFEVHHDRFDSMKKFLIRLSRFAGFKLNCNLWVKCRYNQEKVQLLIRHKYHFTPYYKWGQLFTDPNETMKECLAGSIVRADIRNYIVYFAPIRDSLGKVTGFVEVVTRTTELEEK